MVTEITKLTRLVGVFTFFLLVFNNLYSQDTLGTKKYLGLLWEISGNGLEKPSYLYGTMHVSNKLAFHLTDTFYLGIKNCDVVALEQNPANWMKDLFESNLVKKMFWFSDSYNRYKTDFYDQAFMLNIPENKDFEKALHQDHNLTNPMLYRYSGNGDNFEENTYLDLFIFQAGKKFGKEIASLEKFKKTMEYSQKAMKPDKDDIEAYNKYKSFKMKNKGKSINELIEEAYRKGDLDLLDSLQRMINPSKNYHKYMIVKRNEIMANNMDSLMRKKTIFTGIGAAHLPGNEGVISLLRAKGYKLRPVVNTSSSKSKKMKDKIETLKYGLNYVKQYPADSFFVAALPGDLVETPKSDKYLQYFYPEMINGAYYTITRINTYSPLIDQDHDYMMKRIDSLLYENIPGKIIKKKIIEKGGFTGFDIVNKTRRGDIQHFQIFVTPLELIIFKMGGTSDFVNTKEGSKFFNSIDFIHSTKNGWYNFTPGNGEFSVDLPSYRLNERNEKQYEQDNLNHHIQAIDQSDSSYYLIVRSSLFDYNYIEEDTFELDMLVESIGEQFDLKTIEKVTGSFMGYPSIDAHFSNESRKNVFVRIIIKGPHYYLLLNKTNKGEKNMKFFDSFSFGEYIYSDDYKLYNDTTMHFSVMTIADSTDEVSFDDILDYGSRYEKKDTTDKSYLPEIKHRNFYSKWNNEKVHVMYQKFHKYYSPQSKDSLWEDIVYEITDENNLIIKDRVYKESDSLQELFLVLTDTNSARCIKHKMILKGGVMYTLSSYSDTLGEPGYFERIFFESFRPSDTVIGTSIFDDKTELFFDAITNGDSLTKEQALQSIKVVEFKNKDAEKLISYIGSDDFGDQNLKIRVKLIRELGGLINDKIIPFLTTLYKEYSDTVTLQLAVLEALTWQSNEKAINTFLSLLNDDTPLTSDGWSILLVFSPMFDSLELAASLYPSLLNITKYPEYKGVIYQMLAVLVDSGIVDKKVYNSFQKDILREAGYELKRQFASEENSDEDKDNRSDIDYDLYSEIISNEDMDLSLINDLFSAATNDNKSHLEYYSILLAPFYDDPKVQAYFDKLMLTKDKNLKLNTALLLLKNNRQIDDTVWNNFCADISTRLPLYKGLKNIGRLDKYDSIFLNQKAISEAILYATNFSPGKDSMMFIGKQIVTIKENEGYIYFYKSKKDGKQTWKLDYCGLQPIDTMQVEIKHTVKEKGVYIDEKDENFNDMIKESIEDVRLEGRRRVKGRRYDYNKKLEKMFDL